MPRYSVKIGEREYDVTLNVEGDENRVLVNGKELSVSAHSLSKIRKLVIVNNQPSEIDIHTNGNGSRLVFLKGFDLDASVEDFKLAQLKKKAGFASADAVETRLKSTMPGLVVEIKVGPGDAVDKGMPLLVLEAMKMENVIKAKGKAVVKTVKVSVGEAVEKGDILVEFE